MLMLYVHGYLNGLSINDEVPNTATILYTKVPRICCISTIMEHSSTGRLVAVATACTEVNMEVYDGIICITFSLCCCRQITLMNLHDMFKEL